MFNWPYNRLETYNKGGSQIKSWYLTMQLASTRAPSMVTLDIFECITVDVACNPSDLVCAKNGNAKSHRPVVALRHSDDVINKLSVICLK